ncbi:hypothetical protein C5748_20040 [Phyllobacterium phragmitis]|uniref:Uncharacterized protein n=1 Tax=Phyllobacterium phragmitis TaxID=2670329 RepID=A0A2S9IMJ4_9HYPH|nr:hypothetical protein [Phyllobacterium phragmitis]PRD41753.1 hypothetical protein C5748_20040 [Phyllobacterium phragmitis]
MSDFPADMDPDRMAACFRTVGSSGLPAALMKEPRFTARLANLFRCHYDLHETAEREGEEEDRAIAALSRQELEGLAARAGIVLHARDFLREIRGPVLASLGERFGADALEDARRHADLACERPKAVDLDGLEVAVRLDGQACLAGWIAALPAPLARRVRLKWPNDAAVPVTDDAVVIERGPAILRRLASDESPRP